MLIIFSLSILNLSLILWTIHQMRVIRYLKQTRTQIETKNLFHDIRNSLNNITVFTDMLCRKEDIAPRYKEYLQTIQHSAETIQFLTSRRDLESSNATVQTNHPAYSQNQDNTDSLISSPPPLKGINLSLRGESWLSAFQMAVLLLDQEMTCKLIEEIPENEHRTAAILKQLALQFRYDLLQELVYQEPTA